MVLHNKCLNYELPDVPTSYLIPWTWSSSAFKSCRTEYTDLRLKYYKGTYVYAILHTKQQQYIFMHILYKESFRYVPCVVCVHVPVQHAS